MEVGRTAPLRLAPGIRECLRDLKDAGVSIGIVCDVRMTPAPTLRERLGGFGVLGAFDHWSFSDEVGCFKPWPGVFRHALSGLGIDDPSLAAHVGDSRRTDVAGARAAGMTAIRYSYFVDAPPDTGPRRTTCSTITPGSPGRSRSPESALSRIEPSARCSPDDRRGGRG